MTRKNTLLITLLGAGLLGLGLTKLPTAREGAVENRQILMSSSIGATSSILFVLDTTTMNLAAYEGKPGADGGLRLLGARKIEHDLELKKYRDQSEYSFDELTAKKLEEAASETSSGKGEHH